MECVRSSCSQMLAVTLGQLDPNFLRLCLAGRIQFAHHKAVRRKSLHGQAKCMPSVLPASRRFALRKQRSFGVQIWFSHLGL